MTNTENWQLYTSKLPAPQSFLDFGWIFLITSCLQRRVWYYGEGEDSEGGKLYPNQYVVMCGPPGCGKGIVLSKISYFLGYHKNERGPLIITACGEEKPPLFAMGADSLTFEELLDDIARSSRAMVTPEGKPYIYTSYAFVLQELDSLFRKKADDVARFLKNAYDCGNYDRKTRHSGQTLLRRLCCSLIAGTQLDFIKEATDTKIFGQGFASRTLFLFESEERFSSFHISDLNEDQKHARDKILEWVKKLSLVYGELTYSPETRKWLEDWYQGPFQQQKSKASNKMLDYIARKKVIMLKLAAGIHFRESLDLVIERESFEAALKFLDAIEPKMEAGLNMSGRNPLHQIGKRVREFIKAKGGQALRSDVIIEFNSDVNIEDLESIFKELEMAHGLKTTTNKTGQKILCLP